MRERVRAVVVDPTLSAFSDAYRDHSVAVYRLASRICGAALAEDVTQEVFVALWRHPDRFDPSKGTLRAYLGTIARHKAVDAMRSEGSRRAREVKSSDSRRSGREDDMGLALVRRDEIEGVLKAVRNLPRTEREALVVASSVTTATARRRSSWASRGDHQVSNPLGDSPARRCPG